GTALGAVLGGLLGGAGGALFGPQEASPFTSTGISLDASGHAVIGKSIDQLFDSTQERAQALTDAANLNAYLDSIGAKLTSLGNLTQIGQNTPGGFVDPTKSADLASAFPGFQFSAGTPVLNALIQNRTFSSQADLQNVVAMAASLEKIGSNA